MLSVLLLLTIQSLETHPDRFPTGSPEQRTATGKFQEVNNAYYVLSDKARRREYDLSCGSGRSSSFFGGPSASPETANAQFGEAFEEMLREEGMQQGAGRVGYMYALGGGFAGAILGFIIANIPGLLAGAVAGNRLGSIRDTKGKPVYQVFQGNRPPILV